MLFVLVQSQPVERTEERTGEEMKLLLFMSGTDEVGERLQRIVEAAVPKTDVEICRTIDRLSYVLRRYSTEIAIAILSASSANELLDFLSIGDLLEDMRIILVLPDRDNNTIANAHILRPRFLTYVDSDFAEVIAVLKKMLGNYDPNKTFGRW
jgi:hypothetical protein